MSSAYVTAVEIALMPIRPKTTRDNRGGRGAVSMYVMETIGVKNRQEDISRARKDWGQKCDPCQNSFCPCFTVMKSSDRVCGDDNAPIGHSTAPWGVSPKMETTVILKWGPMSETKL